MPKIYLKHALRAQIIGLNIDLEHFAHLSSNFYRASKNEKNCFFGALISKSSNISDFYSKALWP